jgi:hypothetical protein
MENTVILKNVLDGNYNVRRRVGRPRIRWKDIRRHFLVTAEYEDVRTLARAEVSLGELLKRPGRDADSRATEEKEAEVEKEKEEEEINLLTVKDVIHNVLSILFL